MGGQRWIELTREDDERDLRMLELRDRKVSPSRIAKHFGMTRGALLGKLHRIKEDLAKSEGEA